MAPHPKVLCYNAEACVERLLALPQTGLRSVAVGVDHAASSGDACVLSVIQRKPDGQLVLLECIDLLDGPLGGDALTTRLIELCGQDVSDRLRMLANVAKEAARQRQLKLHYQAMQNVEFFKDIVVNAHKTVAESRKTLQDFNESVMCGRVKDDAQRRAALGSALHHAEGRVSGMESVIRRLLNNPGETIEQLGRMVKDRYLAEYRNLNEVPSSETCEPQSDPRFTAEPSKG